MKILLFITGMGVGGAERQVVDLADNFLSKGHEVILVYMTGEALINPLNKNIKLISLNINKSPISILNGFLKLLKTIREFKPDVLHSHMVHANIFARVARIFSKIPCLISTAHSTNEGGRGRMLAYRLTDGLADISTNVSEEAVRIFEKNKAVLLGRMIAMHNGIDVVKFSKKINIRENIRSLLNLNYSRIFLAVGRLVEAKDYPNLLMAFSEVLKKHEDCYLLIVGDGPLRGKLIETSNNLEISDNVIFLGLRNDVPDLLNASDYFVLSSEWEGFGLVVAEAMATEKIVIATDSGGVAEVLGDSGFLVPRKNPSLLADAMLNSLKLSSAQIHNMGESARQRVISKYSLDSISDKWLSLYKKLLIKII